ncbi:MAG: FAD-binding oxidoreductase [Gammaproteobacteria bacterium]|nr:FAD-binding oxidoreductase [Gammaproteobacteria bacterium]MDH3432708.1 FAD-binding oxidoreductase [Gammaproteobacteria bacterium]
MYATELKSTGEYYLRKITTDAKPAGPVTREPRNLNELRKILDPATRTPLPIRVQGAGTASTDCNATESGTTLKTTSLDDIVNIDAYNYTVTAQAGVRLETLVTALAEHGLELVGGYDLQGRTVGGAIAAPCFGPGIGSNGGYFASNVIAMKIIRADGQLLKVDSTQENLLGAFRTSFGALGIIFEATMRVRPIRTFTATHRRVSIDKFAGSVDALTKGDVGFKFYLMPYRDRVYLDLRRYDADPGNAYNAPWRIKDWGESTVLPHIFKSLNRVVPIQSVRYKLIDSLSEATQGLVNSRLVRTGSNATSQSNRNKGKSRRQCYYSTWCFPAANFSMIVKAYKEFCESIYADSQYRCDLPAVGFRLCQDSSSLLSPSFDEAMIAVTTASTQPKGWDDFVIDLAEFAEKWGGTPMISQSRALRAEHVIQIYSKRLDFFRRLRRQLDPDARLLSPFLAQFCQ